MSVATITPNELHDLQVEILDVRTPAEFGAVHATTAHNVPLDQLDPKQYMQSKSNDDSIYIICKAGGRSHQACEQFIAAGHANVVNVVGGTDAWDAAGLPVARGEKKVMPLDCQVRVFAGGLVVLGSLLSFVSPAWGLLSLFIGAGLVYSGVTNTCGMASVISRMPWNMAKPVDNPIVQPTAGPSCDTGG